MGCSKPRCCFVADRIGCVGDGDARKGLLGCDMCLMLVGLILSIIAVLGMSSDETTVKRVPWSRVEVKFSAKQLSFKLDVDLNLWGVVISPSKNQYCEYYRCVPVDSNGRCPWDSTLVAIDMCKGMSWDDLDDNQPRLRQSLNSTQELFYNDCKKASKGVSATAITSVITSFAAVISRCTCNNRFDFARDRGKKLVLLISTIMPVLTNIEAISQYGAQCQKNVRGFYNDEVELDSSVELGPGYICIIISFVLNFIAFIVQCIVKGNTEEPGPKLDSISKA
mmetsp:Transcript_43062/g.71588  ORF Transcript_43062/g.71588 Transcript_43062/m.71588 type:complete len:280 (-) Transcript_43062:290-1129(-)